MWLAQLTTCWRIPSAGLNTRLISALLIVFRPDHDRLQQHARLIDQLERLEFASWCDVENSHRPSHSPTHRKPWQSDPRSSTVLLLRLLATRWSRVRHRFLRVECRQGKRGRLEGTSDRRPDHQGRRKHRKLSRRRRRSQGALAVHHQPGPINVKSERWVTCPAQLLQWNRCQTLFSRYIIKRDLEMFLMHFVTFVSRLKIMTNEQTKKSVSVCDCFRFFFRLFSIVNK